MMYNVWNVTMDRWLATSHQIRGKLISGTTWKDGKPTNPTPLSLEEAEEVLTLFKVLSTDAFEIRSLHQFPDGCLP